MTNTTWTMVHETDYINSFTVTAEVTGDGLDILINGEFYAFVNANPEDFAKLDQGACPVCDGWEDGNGYTLNWDHAIGVALLGKEQEELESYFNDRTRIGFDFGFNVRNCAGDYVVHAVSLRDVKTKEQAGKKLGEFARDQVLDLRISNLDFGSSFAEDEEHEETVKWVLGELTEVDGDDLYDIDLQVRYHKVRNQLFATGSGIAFYVWLNDELVFEQEYNYTIEDSQADSYDWSADEEAIDSLAYEIRGQALDRLESKYY